MKRRSATSASQDAEQLNTDQAPVNIGVWGSLSREADQLLEILSQCGVAANRTKVDPGIVVLSLDAEYEVSLGITPPYNPEVLLHAVAAVNQGVPVLIFGTYRSFIGEFGSDEYVQSFHRLLAQLGLEQPTRLELESTALVMGQPRSMKREDARKLTASHVGHVREHNLHVIASAVMRWLEKK
jgi:hypothetical protein